MQTATTAWLNATRQDSPQIVHALTLTVDYVAASPLEYEFTDTKWASAPAASDFEIEQGTLVSFTPIQRSLNVIQRDIKVEMVTATLLRTARVDDMIENYAVIGATAVLGMSESGTSDTIVIFRGDVTDYTCRENVVVLKIKSRQELLRDRKTVAVSISDHPNIVLYDLMFGAQGLNDNSLYDLPSLQYDVDTTVSHWILADYGFNWTKAFEEANQMQAYTDLWKALQTVLFMTDGYIDIKPSDGKITYRRTRTSGSSDFDLTEDDLISFEVLSSFEPMYSSISWNSHQVAGDNYRTATNQYDNDSATRYGINPGTAAPIPSYKSIVQDLPYVNGWFGVAKNVFTSAIEPGPSGVSDTFSGRGPYLDMCCGCYWPTFPAAQPTNSKVSSSRPMYLRIGEEIIKIDLIVVNTVDVIEKEFADMSTGAFLKPTFPYRATFRVVERGAFNTSASAHPSSSFFDEPKSELTCFDVTIPCMMAERYLTRFSDGAFSVRVHVRPEWARTELGDIGTITVPASRFKRFNFNGLDTTTKLEVVAMRPKTAGTEPVIEMDLVFAWKDTPESTDIRGLPKGGEAIQDRAQQKVASINNVDVGEKHVLEGLLVTDGGSLDIDISAGACSSLVGRNRMSDAKTITLQASKDVYVYFDQSANGIYVQHETIGTTPEPTTEDWSILLAKVVTGASTITSVTDRRPDKAMHGTKLVDHTVATQQQYRLSEARNHNFDFSQWSRG